MARVVYGKSVWGGYFLDALNRFYGYDARVDRGRSYANSGKVYDFLIIDSNPLILAFIINGKLPSTLLELLKSEKIELFLRDFSKLKRSCSCPDWGDLCKHMAEVYFVLTSMIDNNPFLLFELRKVNLINHYNIKKETKINYPFKLVEAKKEIQNLSVSVDEKWIGRMSDEEPKGLFKNV